MRTSFLILLAGLMLSGLAALSFAGGADDIAKVLQESCTPCHTPKTRPLDNVHMTKEQWKETVERMIDQGAEVPRSKKQELIEYLFRTHGPEGAGTASNAK